MSAEQVSADEHDMPTSVWSGTFRVFGVDIRCHTLSDGQAIIEADSVAQLIEAMESPEGRDIGDLEDFIAWQQGA
jgi:hypothetical protein